MKAAHLLPVLLLLACPIVLVFTYVHDFIAADTALDSGASWDYDAGKADYAVSHTYIPFAERHDVLLALGAWSLAILGVYLFVLSHIRKRKAHRRCVFNTE